MKKVRVEEWIPSDNIVLEDNANFAVKCKKNILVVAGPGAGKTELLAQKAGYLFQTDICQNPQKILAKREVDERSDRRRYQELD